MNDEAIAIDQGFQMLALALTAAVLAAGAQAAEPGAYAIEDHIALARRIVFDARTSAQAGNGNVQHTRP